MSGESSKLHTKLEVLWRQTFDKQPQTSGNGSAASIMSIQL
jgi:hypothetical protein